MSFEDTDDTTEAHERRIVRCSKACNARIVFLQSPSSDKKVPVDADTVEAGDEVYEFSRHASHFKNCTDPGRFSRGKR